MEASVEAAVKPNNVTFIQQCDIYATLCQHKWRFRGIDFFFLSKKSRWHSGTNRNYGLKVLVLLTNSCARGSVFGGTGWHKWRQY